MRAWQYRLKLMQKRLGARITDKQFIWKMFTGARQDIKAQVQMMIAAVDPFCTQHMDVLPTLETRFVDEVVTLFLNAERSIDMKKKTEPRVRFNLDGPPPNERSQHFREQDRAPGTRSLNAITPARGTLSFKAKLAAKRAGLTEEEALQRYLENKCFDCNGHRGPNHASECQSRKQSTHPNGVGAQ